MITDDVFVSLSKLATHPLVHVTRSTISRLKDSIEFYSISSLPNLSVRDSEDGSISIEMRSDEWQFLINIEQKIDESGWSFVFSPQYKESFVFGSLSDLEPAVLILKNMERGVLLLKET